MSSPYSSTLPSGYNINPPPDDGTQVGTNLGTWVMVKTKIGDPLNNYAIAENAALIAAFAKTMSGGSIAVTAVNYGATAADQGRLIRTTAPSVTVTTPDATAVSSPFVFAVVNGSAGGASVGGFGGTQTIDGALSIALGAGQGVTLFTDGSNWFTSGQPASQTLVTLPQGRLTLVTGTPVMVGDVTATTLIYYSPYLGNQISIPNGTVFKPNSFVEMLLTINNTNYIANTIYDVGLFLDPGDNTTMRFGSGPAWSNSGGGTGSRGTGAGTAEIMRLNGMWTNTNAMTMRNNATTYSVAAKSVAMIGSIFIDGTNGQISCHVTAGQSRKWGLFNFYNRMPINLVGFDSTASWTYASATIRQSRATAGNKVTTLCGLAEEWIGATFKQRVASDPSTGTSPGSIGIGFNSTTAYSGSRGTMGLSVSQPVTVMAIYNALPAIGIQNINACESCDGGDTITFTGTALDMILQASWNG